MSTTITHLELKTFLEDKLADYLGTYTYSTGTMAAIALLPHPQLGYYFPPDNWTVSGIEAVIIKPVASPSNSRQMSGGDLATNYAWKIVLKQHTQTSDLHAAMDVLMIALAQKYHLLKDMGGYVPPTENDLIIASAIVAIVDPVVMANV